MLEDEHKECYNIMKRKSLIDYMNKIRRPLLSKKLEDIIHYDLRADYQQVLCLKNYDEDEFTKLQEKECTKEIHIKEDTEEMEAAKKVVARFDSYEKYITKIL